jgi:hypothetical protein
MIFDFFSKKKKFLTPLKPGEKFKLEIPGEKQNRVLYAVVIKVSKKKNILVNFISKDKGNDLTVGIEGKITALTSSQKIWFQSKFLHQEDEIFIFSPPEIIFSQKIRPLVRENSHPVFFSVQYRAMASPHTQKGEVIEFAWNGIKFLANLQIPKDTLLNLELNLPCRETPIQIREKVIFCSKSEEAPKKHFVQVSLKEMEIKDKEEILWYVCLQDEPFLSSDGKLSESR